jgi:hypothetical protein
MCNKGTHTFGLNRHNRYMHCTDTNYFLHCYWCGTTHWSMPNAMACEHSVLDLTLRIFLHLACNARQQETIQWLLGFRYRASSTDYKIKVSNRCNQLYTFIVYVTSHPTCFGPLLAHHQGCPGLLDYATIWFMQCCCLSVRPRTHGQSTALHEPNGSINKQPRTPLMMGQ